MPAALTITGNTNDALAAIAKLERQYDSLENKIKRVKKTSEEGDGGFGRMTQGATAFAQRVTGVASAVDLVVKGIQLASQEWDDFVRRQEKAKDANLSFAQTLTKLALATDAPLPQVREQIQRLSTDNNVPMQIVPEMLNRMQAAKGPTQTTQDVEKTFVAAAQIARHDKESMVQLGETSLDITKQIPGTTPEQAIGFSLAAQAQSRVADPAAFNKNVIPAVLGGNKINNTPLEYGVAISNALTHGSGDTTGKRTNTAQISLEMQMAEALPEFKTTRERIEAMQADPALRDAFLEGKEYKGKKLKGLQTEFTSPDGRVMKIEDADGYSGERRMAPAIKAMLTAGSAEAKIMAETMATLPSLEKSSEEFQRRAKEMREDPNLKIADQNQSLVNSAERARIKDTAGAKGGVVRQGFEENMSAEGIGWMHRQEAGWAKWSREMMGQSPEEAATNTARALEGAYYSRNNAQTAQRFGKVAKSLEGSQSNEMGQAGNGGEKSLEQIQKEGRKLSQDLSLERRRPKEDRDEKMIAVMEKQLEALEEMRKEKTKRPINLKGNVE